MRAGLAILVAALAPGWIRPAGEHAPATRDRAQDEEQGTERLEEWPELDRSLRDGVSTDVQRLRKARTPEMGEQAREALIATGAAVAPELISALGKEKDEEARDRIVTVLDAVTGAVHTRLLARSFDDRSREVRTWALGRAALFPDPGIRSSAEAALTHARKAVKGTKRDREAEAELLAAALAATSGGSLDGLDVVLGAAEDWKRHGNEIRQACEGVRGAAASKRVVELLGKAEERAAKVAAINLLAGCGVAESAVPALRPLLDSDDSTIRIAAINALRGIVDGEPPLDKLSVFDSIEEAKRWKQRIG